MFKDILLPTDGSATSAPVIRKCIAFAQEIGARVTGIYVIPEFHANAYEPGMPVSTPEQYKTDSEAHARRILADIDREANEQAVPCETLFGSGDQPYETIVQVARDRGSDLICMASHGRKGVQGLPLGSETQKVLTHSQVPVLVYR